MAESASSRARWVLRLSDMHRRMLGVWFAILGPPVAYWITGLLGRLLYHLLTPLRQHDEAQCRTALAGRVDPDEIPLLAKRSFVHRVWDLTDLLLAERLLHPGTFDRYGGRIGEPYRSQVLEAQRRRQPLILLTGFCGPLDLLPVFLGYNGIRAGVVYQRHANPRFEAYRDRLRRRSGCELIPLEEASTRLAGILGAGGTVALVVGTQGGKRGLPATFLGQPIQAMRSVGLLAWRYEATVIVAGIRRTREPFHVELPVADIVTPADWAGQSDPVRYITDRYLRGLEQIILADPTQYLWGQTRLEAENR